MNQAEYKNTLHSLYQNTNHAPGDDSLKLIQTLDKAQVLLFDGKEEIQPVKWHQLTRIYKLAVTCIDIVRILWPYLRFIISLLKK
jgi:hypothetical protein